MCNINIFQNQNIKSDKHLLAKVLSDFKLVNGELSDLIVKYNSIIIESSKYKKVIENTVWATKQLTI